MSKDERIPPVINIKDRKPLSEEDIERRAATPEHIRQDVEQQAHVFREAIATVFLSRIEKLIDLKVDWEIVGDNPTERASVQEEWKAIVEEIDGEKTRYVALLEQAVEYLRRNLPDDVGQRRFFKQAEAVFKGFVISEQDKNFNLATIERCKEWHAKLIMLHRWTM